MFHVSKLEKGYISSWNRDVTLKQKLQFLQLLNYLSFDILTVVKYLPAYDIAYPAGWTWRFWGNIFFLLLNCLNNSFL